MGDLLIRNLDEHVIRVLKGRAEVKGTSLQQEVRRTLVEAAGLDAGEKASLLAELDRSWGAAPPLANGVDIVREFREESTEW